MTTFAYSVETMPETMNAARSDKWLSGVEPNDSITRAAQCAIENRLQYLWQCLRKAGRSATPVVEDIHQVRVAARRATAAMDSFAALMPRRRGKWMRTQVKRIRQAAGNARDDDVLLLRLQQYAEASAVDAESTIALPEWQVRLEAERAKHQKPIKQLYRELRRKQFGRRIKRLVKRVHWRGELPEPTYRDAAIVTMREMLANLEGPLCASQTKTELQHPLRIAGKRLRYALELFKGAFTETIIEEECYPLVEALQNLLGDVNDHVSAMERIEQWIDELHEEATDEASLASLLELLHQESHALETAQAAFDQWWQAGNAARLCYQLQCVAGSQG